MAHNQVCATRVHERWASRLLARRCQSGMSAVQSLLGEKRTSSERSSSVAIDPKQSWECPLETGRPSNHSVTACGSGQTSGYVSHRAAVGLAALLQRSLYSALIPAVCMTLLHFSVLSAMNLPNSAGVLA
jgi:hypothetical protein